MSKHHISTHTHLRLALCQTFSLLLVCILTPDNLEAQAASLVGVYMTETWLMFRLYSSLYGVVVERSATGWAELASEMAEVA